MTNSPSRKKIVRVDTGADEAQASAPSDTKWEPTAPAKGQATSFRLIAFVLWLAAIGLELWAILGVLRPKDGNVNMVLLIGLIIAIAILAIVGSILWKRANRLDPPSNANPITFFLKSQLGAIMTVLAFLPLIVMIFLNKDMTGKQKGLAGTIGIVVAAVAVLAFGIDYKPVSVEQYTTETNQVIESTGSNLVYWTKSGEVFHVCATASDLQRESADGRIYEGTVAEAHAAGKDRLTLKVDQERKQCGLPTTSQKFKDAVNSGTVFWAKGESTYHLCSAAAGTNSTSGTITEALKANVKAKLAPQDAAEKEKCGLQDEPSK